MLEKVRGLEVDCVVYDLEDSVISGKKDQARADVCRVLRRPRAPGVRENAIRINSVGSKMAEIDLIAIVGISIKFLRAELMVLAQSA